LLVDVSVILRDQSLEGVNKNNITGTWEVYERSSRGGNL
jgi:hypothetical protein